MTVVELNSEQDSASRVALVTRAGTDIGVATVQALARAGTDLALALETEPASLRGISAIVR